MTDELDRVEFLRGEDGDWWWHCQAHGNNEIIGKSHEGYKYIGDAVQNAMRTYGQTVTYVKPEEYQGEDSGDIA